ncbi:MAG TPA: hypothetical protein PK410_05675 [Paludibacteraceae bacterium]|nr:hypothetical protein [Paludibacteraceae bacterium]
MDKIEKMKLGRRAAYLRRCLRVSELIEQYESDCTIRRRVFEKYIQPELHCSYTTFNNMLNERNPAHELEEIERMMKESGTKNSIEK